MSLTRFISARSPYRRGGLTFDRSCRTTADGRPLIELGRLEMGAMKAADHEALISDPNITVEMTRSPGRPRRSRGEV